MQMNDESIDAYVSVCKQVAVLLLKHIKIKYYVQPLAVCIHRGSGFAVFASPIVLLLDGGGQLLVEAFQVYEAHQQRVSLRPNKLLGLLDIFHLPITGLKPAHI